MASSLARFPHPKSTPLIHPSQTLSLPSPAFASSTASPLFKTFTITFFTGRTEYRTDQKLRISGRLGHQKLLSSEFAVDPEDGRFRMNLSFYYPLGTHSKSATGGSSGPDFSPMAYGTSTLRLRIIEGLGSEKVLASAIIPLRTPRENTTTARGDMPFLDERKKVWGNIDTYIEFLEKAEQLQAKRLHFKLLDALSGAPGVSPVRRRPSPFEEAPTKDQTFDANYPFRGIRVYCYLGAGWKSKLAGSNINIVVGVGGLGLRCEETFTITRGGDFKVSLMFQFPFERERRVKILIQDASTNATLAEGMFDTLDLVNGNVVTCKQQLAFYTPVYGGRRLGFMEILTEFCSARLPTSVRQMKDTPSPDHGGTTTSLRGSVPLLGSDVQWTQGSVNVLSGVTDAQVAEGNNKEVLRFSPVSHFKSLLLQVLAVTDLPNTDDVCTVQVCLGWHRSATGHYHRAKSDLRAGLFELHRLPYAKQRYIQLFLRVATPEGQVSEAIAWLDVAMLPLPTGSRVQILMRNKSTYLGRVHAKVEFFQDALKATNPIKLAREDSLGNTPLCMIVQQQDADAKLLRGRSKSPSLLKPLSLTNFCVTSPLMSPRSREARGKEDAILQSFLDTLAPPSSEPHPQVDLDLVSFQLVGFRDLPDLDGLRLLKLQLVFRVGNRVNYTTHVLDATDTDPNFAPMLFQLPMMELRFLTIDVFERTMTYKPHYLGRVVIDTAAVRPGQVLATYEQLTGPGSGYCLYALENISQSEPKPNSLQQPVLLTGVKHKELPLTKYMSYCESEDTSTTDGGEPLVPQLSKATMSIRLGSLQGMVSPFPFAKAEVCVRVSVILQDETRISVVSAPISMDIGRQGNINQIIKLPKIESKFSLNTLQFSLLAGCPVRRPVEVLSQIFYLSDQEDKPVVVFGDNDAKLHVMISELNEPCRTGACEAIRAVQDNHFPSLISV